MEIITTAIEHPCVLESARFDYTERGIKVHYLPVDKDGLVSLTELKKKISDKTVLISIMYANNEIGTIQPIAEIGQLVSEVNADRAKRKVPPLFFHTDAVQAVNYLDCDVQKLGVDFLSLSAHKIYGPKGVGALFVRVGANGSSPVFAPFFHGGHQEYGKRAGTLNVAGIVGLGVAIELLQTKEHKDEIVRIKKMRDKIITTILKKIPNTFLNGSLEKRLPNNVNITFVNAEGESILMKLDMEGIAVSTGSACASGSLNPSHVILGIGVKPEHAHGSVRITLGRQTTMAEVDRLLKVLPGVIKDLRRMSPLETRNN
jgi:cysteine desulfurase